jgi:hypothetical protein
VQKAQQIGNILQLKKTFCTKGYSSHPVVTQIEQSLFRIYFSNRDLKNRSFISFIDYDIEKKRIVKQHNGIANPKKNSFYENGITLGCYLKEGEKNYLYFMGWNKTEVNENWRGEIGVIELDSEMNIKNILDTPIIKISPNDPISISYPCIFKRDHKFIMIYGSTQNLEKRNDLEMVHKLKVAKSDDGLIWETSNSYIEFDGLNPNIISRPNIFQKNQKTYMLFSYKISQLDKYKIGIAESDNGIYWKNSGELHFIKPVSGTNETWDNESKEYPYSFNFEGNLYFAYNGNEYGRSGLGLGRILE